MTRAMLAQFARAALLSAVVAKAASACVDLESLGNGKPDGGDDSGFDAGPPSDPCVRAQPPGPPSADDSNEELPPFIVAISEAVVDPDVVPGYDLDAVCTTCNDAGVPREGAGGCVATQTTCDLGDTGIDNSIGTIAKVRFPLERIDKLTNRLIAQGQRTVLFRISAYNGRANDTRVVVDAVLGEGIHSQGCPSSQLNAATSTWSPGGCGNDAWDLSSKTAVPSSASFRALATGVGFVKEGTLVVELSERAYLPFTADVDFGLFDPHVVGRLVPVDGQPGAIALKDGVLTGRIPVEDVILAVGSYAPAGERLCTATETFGQVREGICGGRDIRARRPYQADQPCDALSAAIGFQTVPAKAAAIIDSPPPPAECVDAGTSCP